MKKMLTSISISLLTLLVAPLVAQDHGFSNENAIKHSSRVRTYDVHHLKLNLSFDHSAGKVFGTAAITFSPLSDTLKKVALDGVDLSVSSVAMDSIWLKLENTGRRLIVELDQPYSPRDSLTIQIEYKAQPKAGLYFVRPEAGYPDKPPQIWSQGETEFNSHWFPCYDFPNDRMTSEMIVTVPKGQRVISNGELLEVVENDTARTVTYHWRENVPHATYLISLVVGEFFEAREDWNGIPVTYYVEPADSDKVTRSFRKTVDMMDFFSQKIGIAYPYEKYAQTTVRDFIWGGMENISASTLSRNTLHDERAHSDYTSDGLVAHELAHQWWGNLLTCENWNHIWLNEAFATYFNELFVEHDFGHDEFIMEMQQNRQRYLEEDAKKYRRPIVYDLYEDPSQMFDRHTYQKGAWVLHMLRYILGDELWWQAIHHYGTRFSGQTVVTADFQQAVEQAAGRSLDWFFEQWLYRGGYPEYSVSWDWHAETGSVLLNVQQTQTVDEVTSLFQMPVEIEISGDFGSKMYVVDVDQKEETFTFNAPSKPDRVEFDPREQILKKLRFDKSKQELLNQLQHSNHTIGKIRAADWLAKYTDDREVVDALAQTISAEKFWGLRKQAATTLGKSKNKPSKNALIAALRDGKSAVRIEAIKSLAQFEDDDRVENALLNIFDEDSSYYAQAETVRSLVKTISKTAYPVCVQALSKDSHNEVIRKAAFDGFIDLEERGGIDHAILWAAYGKPIRARTHAISALGKLAKFDESRREEIRERLMGFLDESHFRIRHAALRALANLGNPAVIPKLEKMAASEYHFGWKQIIDEAIKKIKMKDGRDPKVNSMTADSLGTSD